MKETDILAEIRAHREALLARFNYDPRALVTYLQELDAAGDRPVVRFAPRPPEVFAAKPEPKPEPPARAG